MLWKTHHDGGESEALHRELEVLLKRVTGNTDYGRREG
jgi:hypothetical protein